MPLPNSPHQNIDGRGCILPDGPRVMLNTASAMDIRCDQPRPVRLEAGQQTDCSRALISPVVP